MSASNNKSMNPEAVPFVSKAATPNAGSSTGPQQPVAQPMQQPPPHSAQGPPFRQPIGGGGIPPQHFGSNQPPQPSFRPARGSPHSPTYPGGVGASPGGYYPQPHAGPPPQHYGAGIGHHHQSGPMQGHAYQQPPGVSFPGSQQQQWPAAYHGNSGPHQNMHPHHLAGNSYQPAGVNVHAPPMPGHHRGNHMPQPHHPHQPPPPLHHHHHASHQGGPGAFPVVAPVVAAPQAVKVDLKRQAYIVLGGRRGQTEDICRRVADEAFPPHHLRYVKATANDDGSSNYSHPLMHLEKQLQEAQSKPTNIIVDDCLVSSVFEAYYCEDILKKHFRVDTVFYLDYTLEKMNAQDPMEQHADRIYHPLGFEVGGWYDEPGHGWLKKISVYDGDGNDRSVEEISREIVLEIKRGSDEATKVKPPILRSAELPPSTLIKGMTLVRDFSLVCALRVVVQPFVDDYFNAPSPQRLMEYAYFTRFAHQLRSYMVTLALIGVRGCLVGYNASVYFLVSGCATLLTVDAACVPSALLKQLSPQGGLSFVLDATCCASESGRHVINVADLLLLKEHRADALIWSERQDLLLQEFSGVDHTGSVSHPSSPNQANSAPSSPSMAVASGAPLTIALQQYWKCEEVDKALASALPHSGFIFAAPGALALKEYYNPLNYFFPKSEHRHVELRIWNARLQSETDPFITKSQGPVTMWAFDAYMLDENGVEQKVEYPVYISEDDVARDFINDGNILELVKDTITVPVSSGASGPVATAQGKGKTPTPKANAAQAAGSASASTKVTERTVLRYVRRKTFALFPMSAVFVAGIWNPKWSTDGLARAMRTLKFVQRSRRRDEEVDANGTFEEDRD